MSDLIQLPSNRLVQLGYPMSVDIEPEGRNPVPIGPSVYINKLSALAACNDYWIAVKIVFHLRKWIPKVSSVLFQKVSV